MKPVAGKDTGSSSSSLTLIKLVRAAYWERFQPFKTAVHCAASLRLEPSILVLFLASFAVRSGLLSMRAGSFGNRGVHKDCEGVGGRLQQYFAPYTTVPQHPIDPEPNLSGCLAVYSSHLILPSPAIHAKALSRRSKSIVRPLSTWYRKNPSKEGGSEYRTGFSSTRW